MNSTELNERLQAVGEKIKAKGWESASIDISISYLAIFDREPGTPDPMILCHPSIRASTPDSYKFPASYEFVTGAWGIKTLEQALAKLEETAANMPEMSAESDRIEKARAKLNDSERRLLGIR